MPSQNLEHIYFKKKLEHILHAAAALAQPRKYPAPGRQTLQTTSTWIHSILHHDPRTQVEKEKLTLLIYKKASRMTHT